MSSGAESLIEKRKRLLKNLIEKRKQLRELESEIKALKKEITNIEEKLAS